MTFFLLPSGLSAWLEFPPYACLAAFHHKPFWTLKNYFFPPFFFYRFSALRFQVFFSLTRVVQAAQAIKDRVAFRTRSARGSVLVMELLSFPLNLVTLGCFQGRHSFFLLAAAG